jgi:hypothetical protein
MGAEIRDKSIQGAGFILQGTRSSHNKPVRLQGNYRLKITCLKHSERRRAEGIKIKAVYLRKARGYHKHPWQEFPPKGAVMPSERKPVHTKTDNRKTPFPRQEAQNGLRRKTHGAEPVS